MYRSAKLAIACASLLVCAVASAEPPTPPPGFLKDLIPEGATIGESWECPDPAEPLTKPECCRISVDIDTEGSVTKADVVCTFKPLEPAILQCELGRKREPRITNSGPVSYSRTNYQEHYPAFRNVQDFRAMQGAADAACDSLR